MGYELIPTVGTFTAEGKREGIVLSKVPADLQVWHASIRGQHVAGAGHNAPVRVRRTGPTTRGVACLGLQVPVVTPAVTISSGGNLSGRVQIAIQKLNSRSGATSDITPIYPPPGIDIPVTPAQTSYAALNASSNVALAQGLTVVSTLQGCALTGSNQYFSKAVLSLMTSGALVSGDYVRVGLMWDSAGSPAGNNFVVSERVLVTQLSAVAFADVTFRFPNEIAIPSGSVIHAVLVAGSTTEVRWATGTTPAYAGGQAMRNNGSWVAVGGSADFIMTLYGGTNVRAHDNFLTLASQYFTVTNLSSIAGLDVSYEDFDSLVVCIRTPELDGWAAVNQALATDSTVNYNTSLDIGSIGTQRRVIPTFNRPMGGLRHVVSYQVGQVKRLIGVGRPGWDNWVDGALVNTAGVKWVRRAGTIGAYLSNRYVFSGDEAGEEQGLDGLSDLTAYNNMLVTLYDCRGDIAAGMPGPRTVPQGGVEIFRGKMDVVATIGFIEELTGSPASHKAGTVAGNMVRAEFRRQVYATVTKGSATVSLTYADDGSPAYIAHLWMIGTKIKVGTLTIGDETVMRVTPLASPRPIPWPTQIYFPSAELILETPFTGTTGSGQFSIEPETKTIYFGGGRADSWEGTAAKLALKRLPIKNPIVGLHILSDQLCAITEDDQVVALTFPRGITEPESVSSAVAYDISSEVGFRIVPLKIQCSSWRSFTIDSDKRAYFTGNTGAYSADQQVGELISANAMFERFQQLHRSTITDAAAAFDPQHTYNPCIRFCGIGKKNEYRTLFSRSDRFLDPNYTMLPNDVTISWHMIRIRRQVQMLYFPSTDTWTSLDNFGDTDSVTTVLMKDGNRRILSGANGRLMLYGSPAVFGNNEVTDVYSINRVRGEAWLAEGVLGTAITSQADGDATDTISVSALSETGAEVNIGYGPFFQSGMWVYKIASDGTWEKAEILFPTTNRAADITLLVNPTFPWTRINADEYTLLFGAREFSIELATFWPKGKFTSVGLEWMRIVVEDNNAEDAFPWPMRLEILTPGGKPTLDRLTTVQIGRAGTRELRYERTFNPIIGAFTTIRLRGLAPPDSHLRILEAKFGVRYEL